MRHLPSASSLAEATPTRRTARRRLAALSAVPASVAFAVRVATATLAVAAGLAALLSLLPAHPLTLVVTVALGTAALHALPLAAVRVARALAAP